MPPFSGSPKGIVVLGSTGSIGTQTLEVIKALPEHFRVVGLAAGERIDLLEEQIKEFQPKMIWATNTEKLKSVANGPDLVPMEQMVTESDVDTVMVATTGRSGLEPTLAAMRAGKAVALSNKEVIVMAGELVTTTARTFHSPLLPVDSEPSAIWQCLQGESQSIRTLFITASGGPFRNVALENFRAITPEQALKHPTWVMGRKITIDSSTLMNKAFEVIESHWLFSLPFDQIAVTIHPQSIIHSMVELADGSVKAQMGHPDMRLPIQYALCYPSRISTHVSPQFNPLDSPELTFSSLDPERYPCFPIAIAAGREGKTYPAVLSAADEEAVGLFLAGQISFESLSRIIAQVLDQHEAKSAMTVEAVLEADAWARRQVHSLIPA